MPAVAYRVAACRGVFSRVAGIDSGRTRLEKKLTLPPSLGRERAGDLIPSAPVSGSRSGRE
ncbi:hypothetical protein GCM10022408_22040 [Hymenobacter fastidiosus]|uniref:Uncharacterized protein n=1 Tax=Hymenobacter fastidiosus TaxID=486264 RepID=A0ABP7SBV6_9BACT